MTKLKIFDYERPLSFFFPRIKFPAFAKTMPEKKNIHKEQNI